MRKWISVLTVIAMFTIVFQPTSGYAKSKSVDQIEKELKQLQEQSKKAESELEQAEQQKLDAEVGVDKNLEYLNKILAQMETVGNELTAISMDIDETENNLRESAKKLDETTLRIQEREKLLDTRVRLMYTDGVVSYLDVLLASTSFVDFLERADSIQAIANQDQSILGEHKRDKELVIEQQKALEQNYAKAKTLYSEAVSRRGMLASKEKEKQDLIAKYEKEIEMSESISEEQDKLLVQLVTKRAALEKEKNEAKAAEVYSTKGFTGNGGDMLVPISGGAKISSNYGYRIHPISGKKKLHTGVDFAVAQGTDIHAAAAGSVTLAEWWSGYGYCVIIDHGDGIWTLYGHIRKNGIKVSKGDTVKRGQKIAESGNTGNSTGPHLHFEVRKNGDPVDPMPYL